jgi:hypothetical protein
MRGLDPRIHREKCLSLDGYAGEDPAMTAGENSEPRGQPLKNIVHYSGGPIGCNLDFGIAPLRDDSVRASQLIFDSEAKKCPSRAMSPRSASPP